MAKSKAQTNSYSCGVKIGDISIVAKSCGLGSKPEFSNFGDDEGMTGSQYPEKDRRVKTKDDVSGSIVFEPTQAQARGILALFFTGTSYALEDDVTAETFTVLVDRSVQGYTYSGCWLNSIKIGFSENGAVEFTLDILGTTETEGAVDVGTPTADSPIIAPDCTIQLAASTYFVISGEIELSRNMDSRFLVGSLTRQAVGIGKFSGGGSLTLDLNADVQADIIALQGTNTSLAFSLAMSDGTDSITLAAAEVVFPGGTPEIGDGPIQPGIDFAMSKASGSDIVTCTVVDA